MTWKDVADNPWYKGGEVPIGSRKTIEHGDWIVRNFPRLGVVLNPSDRIQQSLDLIRSVQSRTSERIAAYDLMEAERTIHEFYYIGRTLLAFRSFHTAVTLDKLQTATNGNLRDVDDINHLPRNTQVELFHYCVYIQADLDPTMEEPDIVFRYSGKRIGCAVKRMRSPKDTKTKSRFRDAVKQLERYKVPGLVCIDVDIRVQSLVEPVSDFRPEDRGAAFDSCIEPLRSLHENERDNPYYIGSTIVAFARSAADDAARIHTGAYYQKLVLFADMFADADEQSAFLSAMTRGYAAFLNLGTT